MPDNDFDKSFKSSNNQDQDALVNENKELRPYQFEASDDPNNLIKKAQNIYKDHYQSSLAKEPSSPTQDFNTPEPLYNTHLEPFINDLDDTLSQDYHKPSFSSVIESSKENDFDISAPKPFINDLNDPQPPLDPPILDHPQESIHKEKAFDMPLNENDLKSTSTKSLADVSTDYKPTPPSIQEESIQEEQELFQEFPTIDTQKEFAVSKEHLLEVDDDIKNLKEESFEAHKETALLDDHFYDHLKELEDPQPIIKPEQEISYSPSSIESPSSSNDSSPILELMPSLSFIKYSFYWRLFKFGFLFLIITTTFLYTISPLLFYTQSFIRSFLVTLITILILMRQEEGWLIKQIQSHTQETAALRFRWKLFFFKGIFISLILSFFLVTNFMNSNVISEYGSNGILSQWSLFNYFISSHIQNWMSLKDFSQLQKIILYFLLAIITVLYIVRYLQRKSYKE